jgi:hypothetical protein
MKFNCNVTNNNKEVCINSFDLVLCTNSFLDGWHLKEWLMNQKWSNNIFKIILKNCFHNCKFIYLFIYYFKKILISLKFQSLYNLLNVLIKKHLLESLFKYFLCFVEKSKPLIKWRCNIQNSGTNQVWICLCSWTLHF